jgi:hypothetical protein
MKSLMVRGEQSTTVQNEKRSSQNGPSACPRYRNLR